MDKKYVMVSRISDNYEITDASFVFKRNYKFHTAVFDSFEAAKENMRKEIVRIIAEYGRPEFDDDGYVLLGEDYHVYPDGISPEDGTRLDDNCKKLSKLIAGMLLEGDYSFDLKDFPKMQEIDEEYLDVLFSDENEVMYRTCATTIRFNIHNMEDPSSMYYFEYYEADDGDDTVEYPRPESHQFLPHCDMAVELYCLGESEQTYTKELLPGLPEH